MTDHHQSAPPRDAAKQVRMVQLDPATRGALADGDLVAANRVSAVVLTPYFVDRDWRSTWRRRSRQVETDPTSAAWITGVIWAVKRQVAVGRAGYTGLLTPAAGRGGLPGRPRISSAGVRARGT